MRDTVVKKLGGYFRRDVVLTVSLCLAVLSCLVVPPGPAYIGYIDFNTLIILFSLMLIIEGLQQQNFLQYIAFQLLRRVDTVKALIATLVALCFFSSMFITNDVALITFVPFGIMILEMAHLRDRLCYTVVLMTIAGNLGSMFTPIGNPQNLYLFTLSGLDVLSFLRLTGPYTLAAALLLGLSVLFGYRQSRLSIEVGPIPPLDRPMICFYMALFLLCVLTVGGFVPHVVLLALVCVALLWKNRGLFARIDYSLILTFTFFFLFVGNIKQLDWLDQWIRALLVGHDRLISVLVSQVISNVPAAMLLSGYSGEIRELIVGTNLGGLGTLIASMASLISYKQIANHAPGEKQNYILLFTVCNVAFLLLLYLI